MQNVKKNSKNISDFRIHLPQQIFLPIMYNLVFSLIMLLLLLIGAGAGVIIIVIVVVVGGGGGSCCCLWYFCGCLRETR